ncbi:MAG TPA: protein phosphatase 2C domain-containing protein [Polyangiaceae bacterium]
MNDGLFAPTQYQLSRATSATMNSLRMHAAAQSHIGKVRKTNEDQYLIGDVTSAIQVREASVCQPNHLYLGVAPLCLLIVADGMGGHAGGEHASALAISSVEAFILRSLGHIGTLGMRSAGDLLRASFEVADGNVVEAAQGNASLAGMGTTMTAAIMGGSEVHIAHAGDSRAYLSRKHSLKRLTRDHTVAEALRERGVINGDSVGEQGAMHHIITNAVGGGTAGVNPDLTRVDLVAGDQLLLCTDGLTNMVTDDLIGSLLSGSHDSTEACSRLVEAALENGGADNITVVVATFEVA